MAILSPPTRTGSGSTSPLLPLFLLLPLLLLAFALRLYRLDAQSIWIDEGISLHLAISSPGEIIADRAANVHPPLYFLLLKGWVILVGPAIFPARFFSVIFSLLQVPAIYAVARRRLGQRAGWIAAVLTSLSPLSVIYAQEVRTYSILPLIYLALLEVSHNLLYRTRPRSGILWTWWGLLAVIGMHLHYSAFFLVAYVAGNALLILWRAGRWTELRRCLTVQLLVGLACLPWLSAVIAHRAEMQAYLQRGLGLTEQVPLDHLLRQVWIFFLTGLTGLARVAGVRLLAYLTFVLLILQSILQPGISSARRQVLLLLSDWLLPAGATLLFWIVRSYSHPRYLSIYAPGLTLLATCAILKPAQAINPALPQVTPTSAARMGTLAVARKVLRSLSLAASALLGICFLILSLFGLRAYFFDPHFAKDDVRGVARYLEQTAGEGDLILVPPSDWSLTFAYRGKAPIRMAITDPDELLSELASWTSPPQRVFVLDYRGEFLDWQEALFFALERAGTKIARKDFKGITLHLYRIDQTVHPPLLEPQNARFGPLLLTHAWVETTAPADTALTLALRWHCQEAVRQRYGVTIRLQDAMGHSTGWPVVARDYVLMDGRMWTAEHWPAGHEVTTYHVLPLPAGVPPLSYTLTIGLYAQTHDGLRPVEVEGAAQGQWLALGTIRLTPALGLSDNPYGVSIAPPALPQPVAMADGFLLLGARLDRQVLSPGQSLFVTLHWEATHAPLPDLHPRLALIQTGQELDAVESAPVGGRYPTWRWRDGETVIEHRRLTLPPWASAGRAEVVLSLKEQRFSLGRVEVEAIKRNFALPQTAHPLDVPFGDVARLVGYELAAPPFTTTTPVTLTLYWQALSSAGDADYIVFTHILAADGHLVGQHDGPPALGARPSRGWVEGEIITDVHPMVFREPYGGQGQIEVGIYEQGTLERVVRADNGESYFLLPVTITIGGRH